MWVTTAARGARRRWGVEKKLACYSSETAGPIVLRFGMLIKKNPLGTVYPVVAGGVPLHVCTCTPHRCISETARPIAFKFAVWLAAHYWRGFHMPCVTFHIAVCTCARAHPISVSQKRLDRSRSNLLCGWEPIGYEVFTCHGSQFTLRSARAHVHSPYLYLRNGLADCAQILLCCDPISFELITCHG